MKFKTQIKEICNGEQNLKGKANLLIDDCFLVRDIRIVKGKGGLFISFPARRVEDRFVDMCFPLSPSIREEIRALILSEYECALEKQSSKKRNTPKDSNIEYKNEEEFNKSSLPIREETT